MFTMGMSIESIAKRCMNPYRNKISDTLTWHKDYGRIILGQTDEPESYKHSVKSGRIRASEIRVQIPV